MLPPRPFGGSALASRKTSSSTRERAAASLLSFGLQRLDGAPTLRPAEGLALVALYECGDGRWIHLHGAFPSLAERTVRVIGGVVGDDADSVARRVARFGAPELEDALAEAGACGAMVRSADEWAAHPQRAALAPLGRVAVTKIADGDPIPVGDRRRPLGGVRVLDLTRVLAGPTNARVLAEHGADVLHINGDHLDNVTGFVIDTGHGKRSASLDLNVADDAETLRARSRDADVFSQGYRGGALAKRGFGPEQLAALRPGIVAVTINCYGDTGPWRLRPGWEQLSQCGNGHSLGGGLARATAAHPRGGRRLHHGLPGGARHYGGAAAAQSRGRLVSRAGVVVSDRDVDRRGRPVRGRIAREWVRR